MIQIDLLELLPLDTWTPSVAAAAQVAATNAVESGRILYLPRLGFALLPHEQRFLSAEWSDGNSKNINLRSSDPILRGARGGKDDLSMLQGMIERFARQCHTLIAALLPHYTPHLSFTNASFRPCEIVGRKSSYRKDDTRLHTDAFPSNPTGGARVLRVFTNVNPGGKPRAWRVGEPFADMAAKFLPRARRPWPGEARLMQALRVTKRRRSEYDHLMLELHNKVKADLDYQRQAPQQHIDFPPGSSWIVYSDQVLHAAMSGQFMMEQTLMLPVSGMRTPETAPLRVLERLTGHRLA
jgi:hypothetical protein